MGDGAVGAVDDAAVIAVEDLDSAVPRVDAERAVAARRRRGAEDRQGDGVVRVDEQRQLADECDVPLGRVIGLLGAFDGVGLGEAVFFDRVSVVIEADGVEAAREGVDGRFDQRLVD